MIEETQSYREGGASEQHAASSTVRRQLNLLHLHRRRVMDGNWRETVNESKSMPGGVCVCARERERKKAEI